MKKFVVKLTERQFKALHESAAKAGINASELVRQVLVENEIIPDDDIQHGGYRERKGKVKK